MKHTMHTLVAVITATAVSTLAETDVGELELVERDPAGWRFSVGVRAVPGIKTRASVDSGAAVSAAGRVKPVSVGNASTRGDASTETSTSETTTAGSTKSTGTGPTKADAQAASGYKANATRYEFDNGYIDLEDAAGVAGETTNWQFDSEDSFDGTAQTVSGTKGYSSTTVTKSSTSTTTSTTRTETKGASGASRTTIHESFAEDLSDSFRDDLAGLDIQIGRIVFANRDFGVEVNVGYTIYDDVECFKVGGRVYTGSATASRGAVERTMTTTTWTDTTETETQTIESGSIATVISQPEFTDIADIRNQDGSIGGASYDGLPVQPGWGTPVLIVTADRFTTVDRPNGSETVTETRTTAGTPTTATSTSRSPGAAVSRTRTVDVRSEGELSLQEIRLGLTPYWKATEWLDIRANLGALFSYAEVETRTSLCADGVEVWRSSHTDDDWKVQGYAGLALAVKPKEWLEVSAGIDTRFPNRKVRFDDGIVSGSVELADWDAFIAVGVRF